MINAIFLLLILFVFQIIDNHVTIRSPLELTKKFDAPIKASYSNFGKIPYGFYTTGRIYYDLENEDLDYACKPFTGINIKPDANIDRSPIVMVDRGSCTYVKKTRNVQNIGGHLALIVNNMPGTIDKFLLNDDGTGSDISIPAVLISKSDGDKIKQFLKDNKNDESVLSNVVVSVEFIIGKTDKVNLQIFFSSSHTNIYRLMKSYLPYHKLIADKVNFTPHYISHESRLYNKNRTIESDHCLASGKYCAQPRYDLGVSRGKEILLEDIRQKCIYLISNGKIKSDEINPLLYWNYMAKFYDNCIINTRFNAECSYETAEDLGVTKDLINGCLMHSFNVGNFDEFMFNNTNLLLERDYDAKHKFEIKVFPTIIVNDKTIYGAWTDQNLFEAVCAGFNHKPNECNFFTNPSEKGKRSLTYKTIVLLILIILIINAAIVWLCMKYIVRKLKISVESADINGRINNVVNSYLALGEGK